MAKCPRCDVNASLVHNLMKHLMGTPPRGHGLLETAARGEAEAAFAEGGAPVSAETVGSVPNTVVAPGKLAASTGVFLEDFFTMLVENKRLPKYQFERRVDAMVCLFLPEILKRLRGWDVEMVVPEFPLKKDANMQSANADHLLLRRASTGIRAAWILFELKTDTSTCSDPQIATYRAAMRSGIAALVENVRCIAGGKNSSKKYRTLVDRLAGRDTSIPLELVYLAPCSIPTVGSGEWSLTFAELAELRLATYSAEWMLFKQIVLPCLMSESAKDAVPPLR